MSRTVILVLAILATMATLLLGCGVAPTSQTALSPTSASDATSDKRVEITTTTPATVPSASGFLVDDIPHPFVDGGYWYRGDGRFATDTTPEQAFFWRDGHYVKSDSSLLEVSEQLKQLMKAKALPFPDHQPTVADLSPDLGISDFNGITPYDALLTIAHELGALGWWVEHTYMDSEDPLTVSFQLDKTANGPFAEDVLLREMLLARKRGLPVAEMQVRYQDQPEAEASSIVAGSYFSETAPKLWLHAPTHPDNAAIQATLEARLPSEEKHPGCVLRSLEVTSSFLESRRVTLILDTTGSGTAPSAVSGYAADILALVQDLSMHVNARIAVLRFDALDPSGTPLLQERHDLDLGRNDAKYVSLDYFPAWASRPATTTSPAPGTTAQ